MVSELLDRISTSILSSESKLLRAIVPMWLFCNKMRRNFGFVLKVSVSMVWIRLLCRRTSSNSVMSLKDGI